MTAAQRLAYWRAFAAACRELGHTTTAARNEYRIAAMREECGVSSSSQIGTTGDYERIMSRFWHDADRDDLAIQYMAGDARRLGSVALSKASELLQSQDQSTPPLLYIAGILHQMGEQITTPLADDWFLDVPEQTTMRVIQIIDSRLRKLAKRNSH